MKNYRRQLILYFLIYFSVNNCASQNQWAHFATDDLNHSVILNNDTAWVAFRGGIAAIDLKTDQTTYFNTSNTNLPNNYITGFNMNKHNELWLNSSGNTQGLFQNNSFVQLAPPIQGKEIAHRDNKGRAFDSYGNLITCGYYYENQISHGLIMKYHRNGESEVLHEDKRATILEVDQNDDIWYSTHSLPVYRSNEDNTDEFYDFNSTLSDDAYIMDIMNNDSAIYIIESENITEDSNRIRIHLYSEEQWSILDSIDLDHILNLYMHDDGTIWISTRFNGILSYKDEWKKHDELNEVLTTDYDYQILIRIDNNGKWWIANGQYNNNRLYSFEPEYGKESIKQYQISNADLNSNIVSDIFIDSKNNVWVSTNSGISKYSNLSWENMTRDMKMSRHWINSISEDKEGKIWLGLDNDISPHNTFMIYDGEIWSTLHIPTPNGWQHVQAQSFFFDKNNILWAATYHGLLKVEGSEWEFYNETNSIFAAYSTYEVYEGKGDYFYVFGNQYLYKHNGFTAVELYLPFTELDNIYEIHEDHEGVLWISSSKGLGLFQNNSYIDLSDELSHLGELSISSIRQDRDNVYWFGTNHGLLRYDGQYWSILNEGVSNSYISSIEVDSFDNVWMKTTQSGIAVYNENGLNNLGIPRFNTLEGTIFLDINEDGTYNSEDIFLPNIKLKHEPSGISKFSSVTGTYKFESLANITNIITTEFDENEWKLTSDSAMFHVFVENQNIVDLDFGLINLEDHSNLEISLTPGFPRCFQNSPLWLTVTNNGFNNESCVLELQFDDKINYIASIPEHTYESEGKLYWEIESLNPFKFQQILVELEYPGVESIGDSIYIKASILNADKTVLSTVRIEQEIVCSYDPNDKQSVSTGLSVGEYSLKSDPLDYTIRFENSGTDTAFNIKIIDTVSQSLDIESFKLISSSHRVEVSIDARVITFDLRNIKLPHCQSNSIECHGFIKFRLTPALSLPTDHEVNNSASIYFDYNPPILTNTTVNILIDSFPSVEAPPEVVNNCESQLFPNPSYSYQTLKIADWTAQTNIYFYNSKGMLLREQLLESENFNLSELNLSQGLYFYKIKRPFGFCQGKLIIF